MTGDPTAERVAAVRLLAVGLLIAGAAAGLGLLWTLGAEWGADLRERRIALAVVLVAGLATGAALLRLRRLVAERLVPLLAIAVTLSAILTLVVLVDAVRAYGLLTRPEGLPWQDPQAPRCHQDDALLGWAPVPGGVCRQVLDGNFDAVYRFDERGFREIPFEGRPELRIFFFGDSYTFGHGVSNEDTFAHRIATRHLDERVQVVNAAVNGYGLVQMYGRLQRLLPQLGAGDLVVFSPIAHDLARNLHDTEGVVPWVFGEGRTRPYPRFEDGEIREGRIGTLGDRAWALLLSGPLTRDFFRFLRRALYAPPNVRTGHEILEAARKAVEERGARFTYLFLPRVNEMKDGRYAFDLSSFDHPDLRAYFPREEELLAAHRFPQDGHWNPKGHAVAARAVVEELVAGGWIDERHLRSR